MPAGVRRLVGIVPNLPWDKTAYVLGRTAAAVRRRSTERSKRRALPFADGNDKGLTAFRRSLETWQPNRPVEGLQLGLAAGTRFHALDLSPNAARLSRPPLAGRRLRGASGPARPGAADRAAGRRDKLPPVGRLPTRTTAVQEKFEIPPLLAGEMMRAVLAGAPSPRTWLAAAVIRLRAGDDPASADGTPPPSRLACTA